MSEHGGDATTGEPQGPARRAELVLGSMVGPYRIGSVLGMGGMGVVYRARDTRLARDVALKVLNFDGSHSSSALPRFESEARAAGALNHPNIVVVYDVGRHEELPYIVSELLQGATLHARLREGVLAVSRVLEWGKQIAAGLAAAHERGIVHRDLKPENVFVTDDGVVKLLDFGLAKLIAKEGGTDSTQPATEPGAVLGTVAYMAPEQAQGLDVDARADLFSFGLILYEGLTGKRAFRGRSHAEVLAAVLRDQPEDIQVLRPAVPPPVAKIVLHCLEKRPGDRFQSARDLMFAIEALGMASRSDITTGLVPPVSPRRWRPAAGLAALAMAAFAAGAILWPRPRPSPPAVAPPAPPPPAAPLPEWRRLTFGRGQIVVARFASDDTFLFDRFTDLSTVRTYLARLDGRDARPILDQMAVLALSHGGELAVLTDTTFVGDTAEPAHGTLARLPMTGGAARPLLENVSGADWSPDGAQLATLQAENGRYRLHYPIGHPIYEAEWGLSHVRVSPSGDEVAFLEHPFPGDDRGYVAYVDREGKKHRLTEDYASIWGLAWSARDDEIWFTAAGNGLYRELRGVRRDGKVRVLLRTPTIMTLHDVDGQGRALIGLETKVRHVRAFRAGGEREVEMGEYEWASVADIADDGKHVTLVEQSDGSLAEYRIYLRATDGSPSIPLATGADGTLSPDGKWILVSHFNPPDELTLIPTGPGLPRVAAKGGLGVRVNADWFPDGKRIVFGGGEAGKPLRLYVRDLESGAERAISGDNVEPIFFNPVSPDGKWVLGTSADGVTKRYPVDGGEVAAIKGLERKDFVLATTADNLGIFVKVGEALPCAIVRIDIATGKRTAVRWIRSASEGLTQVRFVALAPSGSAYAYDLKSSTSDVFLVTGLPK